MLALLIALTGPCQVVPLSDLLEKAVATGDQIARARGGTAHHLLPPNRDFRDAASAVP